MGKVICIIQARLGSTRLPNKIIKVINNKTIIQLVLERVKLAKGIDEVIVATTTNKNDDILIEHLEALKVKYYRGSENDVLARYYETAKKYNADIIVRITSDCPLIDKNIIDEMVSDYKNSKTEIDYISNTIDRTFPVGLDVEVFSFNSLERAYIEAKDNEEREHVTPYIWKNNDKFKIKQYKDSSDNSHIRITVDTIEDFYLIEKIYINNKRIDYISYLQIIEFLNINKELLRINSNIKAKKINDGLFLRELNKDDCNLLYKWANDKETRKNSFNGNPIKFNEHQAWFNKQFNNNIKTYILCNYYDKIGVVSVKNSNGVNIISFSIEERARGMGYGKKIIELVERKFVGKKLTAYVKKENTKSINIFKELGYSLIENNNKITFSKTI